MNLFKPLLIAHATYILMTALWPLIDIESFMWVTGPKTDIWLVKTVGALLIPVSLCMYSCVRAQRPDTPILVLGIGIAIAFICIYVYYSTSDVISDIYLLDAGVELLFLAGWGFIALRKRKAA